MHQPAKGLPQDGAHAEGQTYDSSKRRETTSNHQTTSIRPRPATTSTVPEVSSVVDAPHFMRLMCAKAQGCRGFSCAQENESSLAVRGVVAYGIRSKKWRESNPARLSSGQPPRSRPTSCPGAWASFSRKFHDIQVSVVVEELTSELLERVQDGTLDLALLALPIPGGHLVRQELFRERLHLVVPENHRLSSHSMVHLKQVERNPFLLFKDGHGFGENTFSACGRARLRRNVVFESGQFTTILAMVGGGTGVSVVPQMAVERRKGCRFIPIADERAYRRVGIVQLEQHFRSRAHSTFLRHLQQSAAGRVDFISLLAGAGNTTRHDTTLRDCWEELTFLSLEPTVRFVHPPGSGARLGSRGNLPILEAGAGSPLRRRRRDL